MSELNIKYNELSNEIYRNFMFYIPMSVLIVEEYKKLAEESKSVIDRITYIDDDLNFNYGNNLDLLTILLKSDKLKSNCFKLLEFKKALSDSDFNYLSESYLKLVQTYTYISNQLWLGFRKNSPVKDVNTETLFNYQKINLNTHMEEVNQIIGLESQTFNQHDFIQDVKEKIVFRKFSKTFPPKEKHFRDFISHQKNKEIELAILKKHPTIKGKKLRYIIDFLIKKDVINITHGVQTELYNSLKKTFNCNIGTYTSIFGYKLNDDKNSDYSRMNNELEILLKEYF